MVKWSDFGFIVILTSGRQLELCNFSSVCFYIKKKESVSHVLKDKKNNVVLHLRLRFPVSELDIISKLLFYTLSIHHGFNP